MTDETDLEEIEGQTPDQLAPDNKLAGITANWNTDAEWDGHDYASVPVPHEDDRPKWEWSTKERRAYVLSLLREYGTWDNVPYSQRELGEQFGVPQNSIHQDVKELRRYIRFHAGNKAISMTETVAQKAVKEQLENEDYFKALQAQLDYNEWLFELGRLDRAPDKKQVHQINESVSDDSLDEDEEDHFAEIADKLQQASDQQHTEPVDVDFEEVDPDD